MKNIFLKAGLVAGIFFLPLAALSTTFGPIPVVGQIETAQYMVRGRVIGASWAEMEPRIQRPYTYWKLSITSQSLGESLGAVVIIRQPGGEIGDMGYRVAGAAEFKNGEDVFVPLRDTDQAPNVKEVVGLASGKYTVEKLNGKEVVMSGLGLPVTSANGERLDSRKFEALIGRVSRQEITEEDRSVFVNKLPMHERDDPALEAQVKQVEAHLDRRPSSETSATASQQSAPTTTVVKTENPPQEALQSSEEPGTGTSVGIWVIALGVAGLLIGLFFLLRR